MRPQADSGAQTLTAVRVLPDFSHRKALARCAVHPMAVERRMNCPMTTSIGSRKRASKMDRNCREKLFQ
jgi:hypothetical protein